MCFISVENTTIQFLGTEEWIRSIRDQKNWDFRGVSYIYLLNDYYNFVLHDYKT